jgi:hypothetical protein
MVKAVTACISAKAACTYLWQELQLVCHKHHCLLQQEPLDALVKDVLGSVLVHSRERVVQQHQLSIMVGCPRKAHTLALAA